GERPEDPSAFQPQLRADRLRPHLLAARAADRLERLAIDDDLLFGPDLSGPGADRAHDLAAAVPFAGDDGRDLGDDVALERQLVGERAGLDRGCIEGDLRAPDLEVLLPQRIAVGVEDPDAAERLEPVQDLGRVADDDDDRAVRAD